jgi:hypothetical protein
LRPNTVLKRAVAGAWFCCYSGDTAEVLIAPLQAAINSLHNSVNETEDHEKLASL